jgi:hypothetical protein
MAVGGGTAVGVHGTGRNYGTLCDYIEGMWFFFSQISNMFLFIYLSLMFTVTDKQK